MSATASTVEAATASTESAKARMSHAGESVVASHLGFSATANSTERTAVAARVLPLKTLAAETLPRLGPTALLCPATEPFRATTHGCIPTEPSSSTAKTTRYRSVRIRNTKPVAGIVRPHVAAQSRMKVPETVAMEKARVQDNAASEPARSPSPTEPAPQPPAATQIKSQIDAWKEPEANADRRIEERRVVTVYRRSPHPFGVIVQRRPFPDPAA